MSFFRKLSLVFFCGILISPSLLWAQEDPKEQSKFYEEQGDLIMQETEALDIARDMYTQAADFDPKNISANFKAGNALLVTIGKDRASKYFANYLQQYA